MGLNNIDYKMIILISIALNHVTKQYCNCILYYIFFTHTGIYYVIKSLIDI